MLNDKLLFAMLAMSDIMIRNKHYHKCTFFIDSDEIVQIMRG